MRGYTADRTSARARVVTDLVTAFVAAMPERDDRGRLLRCHELVRAAAWVMDQYRIGDRHPRSLGVEVVDGRYGLVEHSWILLRERGDAEPRCMILDVYAVARLPPVQLLWPSFGLADHFRAGQSRGDIDGDVVRRCCVAGAEALYRRGYRAD